MIYCAAAEQTFLPKIFVPGTQKRVPGTTFSRSHVLLMFSQLLFRGMRGPSTRIYVRISSIHRLQKSEHLQGWSAPYRTSTHRRLLVEPCTTLECVPSPVFRASCVREVTRRDTPRAYPQSQPPTYLKSWRASMEKSWSSMPLNTLIQTEFRMFLMQTAFEQVLIRKLYRLVHGPGAEQQVSGECTHA